MRKRSSARERGELVVSGRVDADFALSRSEREGGLFEREQAAERVPTQHVDADQHGDEKERGGDHAEGDQPRGGAAFGGRAGGGEDAAAAVDELAGERVELGGELADRVLQGVELPPQRDLARAQREGPFVFQCRRQQPVRLQTLLPPARVGDIGEPPPEQHKMVAELGACPLQPRHRLELVEAVDQESQRMHGEIEFVHAFERIDIEVQHTIARGLAHLRGQAGFGRARLQQRGQGRDELRGGVVGVDAGELVEFVDSGAQCADALHALGTQQQALGDGVAHGLEAGGELVAGRLQTGAQLGFDVGRAQRGKAVAHERHVGTERGAQQLEFGGRVGAHQPWCQRGQTCVGADGLVQGVGSRQRLAHDGLLTAHHALEAQPAHGRHQHRTERSHEQPEQQALAQTEPACARAIHVRLGGRVLG